MDLIYSKGMLNDMVFRPIIVILFNIEMIVKYI
jgi:hypothetical protein